MVLHTTKQGIWEMTLEPHIQDQPQLRIKFGGSQGYMRPWCRKQNRQMRENEYFAKGHCNHLGETIMSFPKSNKASNIRKRNR